MQPALPEIAYALILYIEEFEDTLAVVVVVFENNTLVNCIKLIQHNDGKRQRPTWLTGVQLSRGLVNENQAAKGLMRIL